MFRLLKFSLLAMLLTLIGVNGKAQNLPTTESYSTDILLNIKLPTIDALIEGAKNSSQVEFYNLRMEGQELTLKTERRKWQEYLSFHGSYQYGVMAMVNEIGIGANYPPIYQYTDQAQSWYTVGATLRLPLDQLFDRRNRIRRQQIKIEETVQERELWYDEHKLRIIELYAKAIEMMNNLRYSVELFSMADGQFQMAQKDYVLGTITAQALSTSKSQQVNALTQLERVKSELISAVFKLEVLSGIEIINRK